MKLSSRQHEIIRIIFTSEDYITIEAIADKLSLSTRTIKRELEEIGLFFQTIGVPLEKKSGSGVKITRSEATDELLNSILDKNTIPVFSSQKRIIITLLTLLFADEAMKRFTLARKLGTSELTVSSDLAKCEEILTAKGITLVKKQGYGIYVVASEERRRVAIFEIIEEATRGFSLLDVPSKTIEQFVSRSQLEQIAEVLKECNAKKEFYTSDRTRDILALHLFIQKTRVESGNKISLQTESAAKDGVSVSEEIIARLSEKFSISYSQGELHFFADIIGMTQGVTCVPDESETAVYIARKLALKLEGGFGILVDAENDFFASLIRHLVTTVNRREKNMDVLNPILGEIKLAYPEIYKMVEDCAEEIQEEIGLKFSGDEIGYLTMHMCVIALDGKSERVEKCGALVVCPSGLVSSKLLAINVEKAFPNMQILAVSSSAEVEKIISENSEIDIVISTFAVESYGIPRAMVSPFVSPKDKDAIEEAMKKVVKREILREVQKIETDMASSIVEKMQVKDIIAEILADMLFESNLKVANQGELISYIAEFYGDGRECTSQIEKDLKIREEIGSTVMPDGKMMLIHAKTSGVEKACFGIARFDVPLNIENPKSEVSGSLVMLAPRKNKQATKVLSEISQALILKDDFYETIKTAEKNEVTKSVKEVLYNYYYDNFKD